MTSRGGTACSAGGRSLRKRAEKWIVFNLPSRHWTAHSNTHPPTHSSLTLSYFNTMPNPPSICDGTPDGENKGGKLSPRESADNSPLRGGVGRGAAGGVDLHLLRQVRRGNRRILQGDGVRCFQHRLHAAGASSPPHTPLRQGSTPPTTPSSPLQHGVPILKFPYPRHSSHPSGTLD